tara:strand:- start:3252 stop:4061 length:810 start_codon:yes stop_codon:yes gene_type:complete
MKIINNKNKLIKLIQSKRNLGFIPTMGAIHDGHLSMIKKASNQCTETIVSIFINKPQFNCKNDFLSYPRLLKKDISILRKSKVNYVYLPKTDEIYPNGYNKKIKISSFKKRLCGKFRPGHFESVVDVIDRFIKIIKPKRIYFGEKDMQQLKIVEDFIKKNKIKTKLIACKTIRDKNGVALSSRNLLLTKNQKLIASNIYKLISREKNNLIKNNKLLKKIKKNIYKFGIDKMEYIKIVDINKIIKPYRKKNKFRIFLSYYLGKTRLIDNI